MERGSEIGIERYKLVGIKLISSEDTTQDYSHYVVITINGVKQIKILNHSAAHLKLSL